MNYEVGKKYVILELDPDSHSSRHSPERYLGQVVEVLAFDPPADVNSPIWARTKGLIRLVFSNGWVDSLFPPLRMEPYPTHSPEELAAWTAYDLEE